MLFVLLGAGFMLSADFSMLNVALPDVGRSVGLGLTGLPWITAGYALPAAGFSLMFGRLADLFGRRKLFLSGVVLLIGGEHLFGPTFPRLAESLRSNYGWSNVRAHTVNSAKHYLAEEQPGEVAGLIKRHAASS